MACYSVSIPWSIRLSRSVRPQFMAFYFKLAFAEASSKCIATCFHKLYLPDSSVLSTKMFDKNLIYFYRATLFYSAVSLYAVIVCLSIRPSIYLSQVGVLPKTLNAELRKHHATVHAETLVF